MPEPAQGSSKITKAQAIELAKATGRTLLEAVAEFSDAFPPLKTVATAIQFIVDRAEKAGENREAMEKLLRRIRKVAELSVESDDDPERQRREILTRELESISDTLEPLQKQNKLKAFLKSSADDALVQEYITKVEQALFDYQLSLIQDLHRMNIDQISYDERNTLDKLSRAKDASFDASDDCPRCLEGTRVEILGTLQSWAEASDVKQVYWLSGHAGSGKSTISQSFAEQLFLDRKLGASFFCSRESTQRSDLKMVFPSIAFQLARANNPDSPKYRKALLRTLTNNPDIASLSLRNQVEELIVAPVKQSQMNTVVLIDALDECKDSKSVSYLLDTLARCIARIPTIRFFITSRPEPHIRSAFRLPQLQPITETMILHEAGAASANADIRLYLEKSLGSLVAHRSDLDISQPWPTEEELDALTGKSAGLFVFASTAVKFIDSAGDDPRDRLREVIENVDRTKRAQDSFDQNDCYVNPYEDLDALYLNILKGASSGTNIPRLRLILGLLVVACDPLSMRTIAGLLGLELSVVKTSLRALHSVLLVPEETAGVVRFHHASLHDFITNPTRCTDSKYLLNIDDEHLRIAQRCFELMKRDLKRNMCDLPRYSTNDILDPAVRDERITEPMKYCCRHWVQHVLADGKHDEHLRAVEPSLEYFLTTQQLMWIEVLSLVQDLRRAVECLSKLREWLTFVSLDGHYSNLLDWVIDCQRFILASFDVIEISVAHIYHSALVFAPEQSLLKQSQKDILAGEPRVILGVPPTWTGPLRTMQVPDMVAALEYSHNGTIIAAGVDHIRCCCHLFWSATGERFADLDAGGNGVQSHSFSYDDKLIATVTQREITLWDVESSASVATLAASSSSQVDSLEFHASAQHGHLLLSASRDGRVTVWDTKTQAIQREITIAESTGQACWLPGKETTAAVGTTNGHILLWSIDSPGKTRKLLPPDIASAHPVSAIVSSPDGVLLASGSEEGLLVIFDTRSGTVLHSLNLGFAIPCLSFSPVSPLPILAIGLSKMVITLTLAPDGPRVSPSYGHASSISSLAFSPDGRSIASGTYGSNVLIWEVSLDTHEPDELRNHLQYTTSGHFSTDGKLLVTSSEDQTVRVWDTTYGTLVKTLRGHSATVQDAVLLHDGVSVSSIDQQGQAIAWDIRENFDTTYKRCEAQLAPPGPFDFLAPFTCEIPGFFYIARHRHPRLLECWTMDATTEAKPHLVLAAKSPLPRHDDVLRIYHEAQDSDTPACRIILEYKSGHRFLAVWDNATYASIHQGTVREPEVLEFIDQSRSVTGSGAGSVGESPMVGAEQQCLSTEDGRWVSDEHGRRLLYPSALRDGYRRWCGKRLLLQVIGTGGAQLTLLDFEGVTVDDGGPF